MALKLTGKNIFENIQGLLKGETSQLVADENGVVNSFFAVGSTIDTNATPASTNLAIPTQTELNGEYAGSIVTYEWINHSGATDAFTYTVENTTKSQVIMSETLGSVGNGVSVSDAAFITSDKNDIGDNIRFRFTNGVIGTAGGETQLGYVNLKIQNYIKIKGVKVDDIQFGQVQL